MQTERPQLECQQIRILYFEQAGQKSSKIDDNNWAIRVATDLKEAANKGQQRKVWAKIKISGRSMKKQATSTKDKDGKIITDPQPEGQLKRAFY